MEWFVFLRFFFFFFQAEDGIRDTSVTGVQTCALPISIVAVWRDHPGEYRVRPPPGERGRNHGGGQRRQRARVHPSAGGRVRHGHRRADRKSTRLNSSHRCISYAVFCLKTKRNNWKYAV